MKNIFGSCLHLLIISILHAQQPKLVVPVGHTLGVYCVNISADGKRIVTGGRDNTAMVWDAASGKLVQVLRGHTELISSVQFSPDGKRVLTTAYDNIAAVWDIYTGKYLGTFIPKKTTYPADILYDGSFNADGSLVCTRGSTDGIMVWEAASFKMLYKVPDEHFGEQQALFSTDGTKLYVSDGPNLKILDAKSGQPLKTLTGGQSRITSLSVSALPQLLLANTEKDGASVWDIASGIKKTTLPDINNNYSAFLSADGKYALLTAVYPRSISAGSFAVWDVAAGKKLYDGQEKTNHLRSNHFSADGKYFITSPNNGTTKLWETNSGKLQRQFTADSVYGLVDCARFSTNGKWLLTGGFDRAAHLWDIENGFRFSKLSGHTLYTNTLQFSKDGKYFVTASDDGMARVVEAATGTTLQSLKGHKAEIMYSEFSPNGQKILTVSRDATAAIWDAQGKLLHQLKGHHALIFRGAFSPDGFNVVTASNDSTAKVWDVNNGQLLLTLRGHKGQVWNAHFSSDGKKIVTASMDSTAMLWEAANGKKLFLLDYREGGVADAVFSPDNSKVLLTGNFKEPVLYDANTGKGVLILDGHKADVYTAAFSHDGNTIYTGARDGIAGLWSTVSGSFIRELKGHSIRVNSAQFSKDDSMLLTTSEDRTARVWRVQDGTTIATYKGHTDFIRTGVFGPGEKTVLTVSEDNTIKQWSFDKKMLEYTRVELDGMDYMLYTPSGYYLSSPDASKKLHYVTDSLQVINFDQLDLRYNRPDKVLSSFDNPNLALIQSYNLAWQKRVKKMGVDTTQFQPGFLPPQASISNRNSMAFEQTNTAVTLMLSATDNHATLKRYNIWINDVPVFGAKGKEINSKANTWKGNETITLSAGINRIEFSVVNSNGIESIRTPLVLQYKPTQPVAERVYFVGIGLDDYANRQYNLTWSVKDIRDMAAALKQHFGSRLTIDTLFNQAVTKENVLAIKKQLQLLSEDDRVMVSYSGHGVLSKEMDYFLSTYSINFESPSAAGLPYDDLESLMDGIRPRKKLILIDACHSGEVDKEEAMRIETAKANMNANGVTARSSIKIAPKKNLGMNNSFELMQQLFANVSRGTGATIISAAGAMQYAQERGDLKNGVFTYSILQAFSQHKTLKVSELKKIVGESVMALTNGLQKPTSRNETINVDWDVW